MTRWLAGHSSERLAALLLTHPSFFGVAGPAGPVRSLTEVARRLRDPGVAREVIVTMPKPLLQVCEALAALGPEPVGHDALAAFLARDPADVELTEALTQLSRVGVVVAEEDELVAPAPLRVIFRRPLKLGPPAADLYGRLAPAELLAVAERLGLPTAHRSPRKVLAALVAFARDAERVRDLAASAPGRTSAVLRSYADGGRTGDLGDADAYWGLEHGLLVRVPGWDAGVEMPAEICLALRGPGYVAPFDPNPPVVAAYPAPSGFVERDSAAALASAVEGLRAVVDECGRQPLALLRTGGVGVRELRRLAKRVGRDEQEVRLWVEIAEGLAALSSDDAETICVTDYYESFRRLPPAQQADLVVHGWLHAPTLPTWRPADGRQEPALLRYGAEALLSQIRMTVLEVAGQVLTDVDGRPLALPDTPAGMAAFVAAVAWYAPVLAADLADGILASIWTEAAVLGLVAQGAPTRLGLAAVRYAEDECPIRTVTSALVGPATEAGIFQADLTVLVPGFASAALCDLLDSAADRESRGIASTWRFSENSVRRALDAGATADGLAESLAEAARPGSLPQPLRYLIQDVARRHGALRVRQAGCVISSADETLLAEVLANTRLRALGLWQPASAVLVSGRGVAETLAHLRAAGYAPVEQGPGGGLVLERLEVHRIPAPVAEGCDAGPGEDFLDPVPAEAGLFDPLDLAERLLREHDESSDHYSATPAGDGDETGGAVGQDREQEIDYLERLFRME